ncbi:predicted branched-chain amino acid permease [Burkholderiales bacterium GJ-E10]|nr:predicted branched-chain amino acid permease [Burkholderiales bacterium GJ-E10]
MRREEDRRAAHAPPAGNDQAWVLTFVPNDPEVASCGGGAAGAEGAGGAALGFAAIGFAITAFAMLAEEIAIPIRFSPS